MFITPFNSLIAPLEAMEEKLLNRPNADNSDARAGSPTFLDVFSGIIETAQETDAQKKQDMLDEMLGNVDNIEEIQTNTAKAEIALELLVTVKNTMVDAYNEIIKMSI